MLKKYLTIKKRRFVKRNSAGFCGDSVFFSIFINDLNDGIECILIKYATNTKLGRTASTLQDRIRIRNNLDKL